jgi:hypothetical protein
VTKHILQRKPGFEDGAKVKMKVSTQIGEGMREQWKRFTVVASRCPVSSWQYQLNDSSGKAYDGGNWFAEIKLKPAIE